MDKEYISTFYHGSGSFIYRCKVCGHSLDKDDYNYCPHCGANFKTGQLPLNLYVEGFRNGLSTASMLKEEGGLDG